MLDLITEHVRTFLQKEFEETLTVNDYFINTPNNSKAICRIFEDHIRVYIDTYACYVIIRLEDPDLFSKVLFEVNKRFKC